MKTIEMFENRSICLKQGLHKYTSIYSYIHIYIQYIHIRIQLEEDLITFSRSWFQRSRSQKCSPSKTILLMIKMFTTTAVIVVRSLVAKYSRLRYERVCE